MGYCTTRRSALAGGVAATLIGAPHLAQAQDAAVERAHRPKKGDRLVFASGPKAGTPITLSDLVVGDHQVFAWAFDPETKTIRDGSRLNQVLIVRQDEGTLDEATKQRSVEGVTAYSAICPHALCPVTEWNKDREVLHCPCHNSEYNPREGAAVVNGPALRPLAALPLGVDEAFLVVAQPFIGKVGAQQA